MCIAHFLLSTLALISYFHTAECAEGDRGHRCASRAVKEGDREPHEPACRRGEGSPGKESQTLGMRGEYALHLKAAVSDHTAPQHESKALPHFRHHSPLQTCHRIPHKPVARACHQAGRSPTLITTLHAALPNYPRPHLIPHIPRTYLGQYACQLPMCL